MVRFNRAALAAALMIAGCAAPVAAQTVEQRLAALEAKVALQDSIIGARKFIEPQILCSEMEARRPAVWFPNGEYDLAYRNRQFGCDYDPFRRDFAGLQASFAGWASRLSIVETKVSQVPVPVGMREPPPNPARGTRMGIAFDGGNPNGEIIAGPGEGEVVLRANLDNSVRQEGKTFSPCGSLDINGWDGGLRLHQNANHCGSKERGYFHLGGNSRGTLEFDWFPPEIGEGGDAAPSTAWGDVNHPLYPIYRGQLLAIDGGAQSSYDYSTGAPLYASRALMIASQQKGWPMYFSVSWDRPGGFPMNRAVMKLNSDGSANPVEVVIDGTLRRLKSCNVGGVVVVCL